MGEFTFEIIEHIATVSRKGKISKEINKISYNGNKAVYDIRNWKTEDKSLRTPLKGITFNDEEWEHFTKIICEKQGAEQ